METINTFDRKDVLESRDVARMLGKKHNYFLMDLRQYLKQINTSANSQADYFIAYTYLDAGNKERLCYLITRKGCEFIAGSLTRLKSERFTVLYKARLNSPPLEDQTLPQLIKNQPVIKKNGSQCNLTSNFNGKKTACSPIPLKIKQAIRSFEHAIPVPASAVNFYAIPEEALLEGLQALREKAESTIHIKSQSS